MAVKHQEETVNVFLLEMLQNLKADEIIFAF